MAAQLDLPDTVDAEYIALTKLQANARVTGDTHLSASASGLVSVTPIDRLATREAPSRESR
ncbi:MAG: pyruvate ferredoxin oxidoreductase [Acidimicrobiia bacterium]